jgi:hypothetical protein
MEQLLMLSVATMLSGVAYVMISGRLTACRLTTGI